MFYSVCATLYLRILLSSEILIRFFCSFTLVKKIPESIKIYFFFLGKMLCLLLMSKFFFSLGYLFMDELQRAVAQFYPSTSGGMNGGFNPSPVPENSSILAAASHETEGQPEPGSSHLAPHQVEVGKKKLLGVLERHLRKHCLSPEVRKKFPQVVDWQQEDFKYFTENLAISELDVETLTDSQINDLAEYIRAYSKIKTVLNQYLDTRFSDD